MSLRRTLIWGLPALAYAAFVRWYTDFGGPLDDDGIETYLARLDTPDHSDGDRERIGPGQGQPETFLRISTIFSLA